MRHQPRFSLTGRRTVVWLGIIVVVLITFISLTKGLKPNSVLKPGLSWLIALLAWALAVLAWDLAIVWIEYVSEGRHLDYLKEVWGIREPRSKRTRRARAGRREVWPGDRAPEQRKVWWIPTQKGGR